MSCCRRSLCIHMSIAGCKQRLTYDPTVGVSELMQPLKKFIKAKDDKNVYKMVMPPPQTGWKNATPVGWLCGLAPLFKSYLELAPNSIISKKRHKSALMQLEENEKVNFTKKTLQDFVDQVDDALRMGLSHLRLLKQVPEAKERAYRKADQGQQQLLDSLLEIMNVQGDATALVPAAADYDSQPLVASGPASSSRPPFQGTAFERGMDFESIFDAVIDNDEVDGVKIEITKNSKDRHPPKAPATPTTPSPKKTTPGKGQKRKNSGAFELAITEDDKKLLEEAKATSPIHKKGKSQQQRLNALKPKKSKAKAKAAPKKIDQKDGAGKGSTKNKAKAKAKSNSKRTSITKKEEAMETAPHVFKKPASVALTGVAPDSFPNVLPDWVPDPATTKESRSVIRARFVSQGYHKTKDALKKTGVTDREALNAAGRRGHKEAGEIFDTAWPLETSTDKIQEEKDASQKKKKKTPENEKNNTKNEEKMQESKTKATTPTKPIRMTMKGPEKFTGGGEIAKEPWDAD